MSSNFIFLKALSLEKDKNILVKVIASLINYSKSIEIVKTKNQVLYSYQ